jgi:ATP-dependent Clp protease adapter protein ClpS
VPAAALLLFDRGVINCGPFAQLILTRITFMTRARSTLAWQIMRTVHRAGHAGDAVAWSGRSTDRV